MHGARWVYAVQDYLFKAEPKYVKKRVADLIDRSVSARLQAWKVSAVLYRHADFALAS